MRRVFPAILIALLAACGSTPEFRAGGLSLRTEIQATWKDPKFEAPMHKIFVISLMKVDPGGRGAVEDAIAARLASTGVAAVASHTVMPKDADAEGPVLEEAIKASGADGVLLVTVKSMGAIEPNIGATVTSISPDTLASYNYLKGESANQPGDYKVATIVSEVFLPSLGKQVWTAYSNSYDASNLARNIPDYTMKLVTAMAKDKVIAGAPKPS